MGREGCSGQHASCLDSPGGRLLAGKEMPAALAQAARAGGHN